MRIIDDLLSKINYKASVREVCQCPFHTIVQTRYCELVSTPHEAGSHHAVKPVQEAGLLTEKTARDHIAQQGFGKKVAIVGHFPFIVQLRGVVKELCVIRKNPRGEDHTEDEAEAIIPQADVVGITGTAFTNHTIEQLFGGLKECDSLL